jgi:hypothetical protein
MEPTLKSKTAWRAGAGAAIESVSPHAPFAVVFEDDGTAGFVYAIDRSGDADRAPAEAAVAAALGKRSYTVVDALHIYNAESFSSKPTIAEIRWSPDGLKAALFLGNDLHAVVDFAAKRGVCRTGSPPSGDRTGQWTAEHAWDERVARVFTSGPTP